MNINDISGASTKLPYQRKSTFNNIDYRDVTAHVWESKRNTNPLRPEYKVRDRITEGDQLKMTKTALNAAYGKIDGNQPQSLPPPVGGVRNLETRDIKGAQHDTKLLGSFTYYQRRADQIRAVTNNDDVPGSKCGSLLKGIVTQRQTHPLQPVYKVPGNSETNHPVEINNPYAEFTKKANTGG